MWLQPPQEYMALLTAAERSELCFPSWRSWELWTAKTIPAAVCPASPRPRERSWQRPLTGKLLCGEWTLRSWLNPVYKLQSLGYLHWRRRRTEQAVCTHRADCWANKGKENASTSYRNMWQGIGKISGRKVTVVLCSVRNLRAEKEWTSGTNGHFWIGSSSDCWDCAGRLSTGISQTEPFEWLGYYSQ